MLVYMLPCHARPSLGTAEDDFVLLVEGFTEGKTGLEPAQCPTQDQALTMSCWSCPAPRQGIPRHIATTENSCSARCPADMC